MQLDEKESEEKIGECGVLEGDGGRRPVFYSQMISLVSTLSSAICENLDKVSHLSGLAASSFSHHSAPEYGFPYHTHGWCPS